MLTSRKLDGHIFDPSHPKNGILFKCIEANKYFNLVNAIQINKKLFCLSCFKNRILTE